MKKIASFTIATIIFLTMSINMFALGSIKVVMEIPKVEEIKSEGAKVEKIIPLEKESKSIKALESMFTVASGSTSTSTESEKVSPIVQLVQQNTAKLGIKLDEKAGEKVESVEVLVTMDIFATLDSKEGKATISFSAPVDFSKEKKEGYAYAVMHMNEKDQWEILPTKLVDGKIVAEVTSFSPFAIVLVKTSKANAAPQTTPAASQAEEAITPSAKGSSNTMLYVGIAVVAVAAIGFVVAKGKKKQ